MKKRILCFVLMISMLSSYITALPITASAVTNGICGESLTWVFDTTTGVLTINGMGDMWNWESYDAAPWFSQKRYIKSVVISSGVTTIGKYSFWDYDSLISINIPDGVTNIAENTFGSCDNLTSIRIPKTVRNIGQCAFSSCSSMSSIEVDESNEYYSSVDGVLFDKTKRILVCTPSGKIGKYIIPSSVTSICDFAFYGCYKLTDIEIPNSVTSIGSSAFLKCDKLERLEIPDSVLSIGYSAFHYCEGLKTVKLPNKLKAIESYLFSCCINLTDIKIPDSVTRIESNAFSNCSKLTNITIPRNVNFIFGTAFGYCENLNNISVDKNNKDYTSIDGVLFNKNKTILVCFPGGKSDSYLIPRGTTTIGVYAFSCCENLKQVTIPRDVTSIKNCAFLESYKFQEIFYEGSESDWKKISIDTYNDELSGVTVHYNCIVPETTDYLLTRFALCQLLYGDVVEDVKVKDLKVKKDSELKKGEKKVNKNNNMYFFKDEPPVKYKEFYSKYINDFKVLKVATNSKGFYGAAFESPQKDIIIAYRGTENFKDIGTDAHMVAGWLDDQFDDALKLYDDIKSEYPSRNITLTGHSLGGALASYVAINRGVRTDNVNGATGWMLNNKVISSTDKNFITYKGLDQYVFENFNQKLDLKNFPITQFANMGAYNYKKYEESDNYNKRTKYEGFNGAYAYKYNKDYHSLSSLINYVDKDFVLTKTTKEHTVKNFTEIENYLFLGTAKNDKIEKVTSNAGWLYAPHDRFVLCGDGDDVVIFAIGGNDTILGNGGNDILCGGTGDDLYVFGNNWGSDIISDPSGEDVIQLADVGSFDIEYRDGYAVISCYSNAIVVDTTIRADDIKVLDEDGYAATITCGRARTFSLRNSTEATKGISLSGNFTAEVYDAEETLIDTIVIDESTAESIEYKDYGMLAMSSGALEMILPSKGYVVKATSSGVVNMLALSDADNPAVATQTYDRNIDLSDGTVLVFDTAQMVNDQMMVNLLKADGKVPLYCEPLETFVITADKTEMRAGETITMSVPEIFKDSVIWECSDKNVIIKKNEDFSVSVTTYKTGDYTIEAYLPNDELYSAENSITVTADSAPQVAVTYNGEAYEGDTIATDNVVFDVTMVAGYDEIVFDTTNSYVQLEGTNTFVVNSVGEHYIEIYCRNSQTGAETEAFVFEFIQDSEPPVVEGVEDSGVYYIDRLIEVVDTSIDEVYVDGELTDEEAFIISEVGVHTVSIVDNAGNSTSVSFEIKAMPSPGTLGVSDVMLIRKIRNDFEEIKYSLPEDRMLELETEISALEAVVNTMYVVTVYEDGRTKIMTLEEFNSYSPIEKEGFVFMGWYLNDTYLPEDKVTSLDPDYGQAVSVYAWYLPVNELVKVSDYDIVHENEKIIANIEFEYAARNCKAQFSVCDENSNLILSTSVDVLENSKSIPFEVPFVSDDKTYYVTVKFKDENQNEIGKTITDTVIASKKVESYNGFKYKLTDNKAEIVGYENTRATVYIPIKLNNYDVVSIAGNAFEGKSAITTIVIPNTLESIAKDAFEGCINLKTINYTGSSEMWELYGISKNDVNGADVIYNYNATMHPIIAKTLYEKETLTLNLRLMNNYVDRAISIRIIDQQTNQIVKNLSYNVTKGTEEFVAQIPFVADDKSYKVQIIFPGEVGSHILSCQFEATMERITIGDYNCGITNGAIVILKYIGDGSSVNIPAELNGMTVYKLGKDVFSETNIKSITLPNTIKTINSSIFNTCYALEAINVSNENEAFSSVDGVLFDKRGTVLIKYPIAKQGETFEIPDTVENIYNMAFANNKNIKNIIIPEGVTLIMNNAFSGTNIKSLDLPASLNGIQEQSFSYCYLLESLNVHKNNEKFSSLDGVLYNKNKTLLYQYPIGRKDKYFNVSKDVLRIGNNAFLSSKLKSILLPDTITTINDGTFSNCIELTSIIYCGTEEGWLDITMSDAVKESLGNVELIYGHKDKTRVYAEVVNCVYESEKVTANINLKYIAEDCKAILAVYTPDGKMINLSSESITTEDLECKLSVPVNIDCKGYSYKIFFWRDYASLEPQTEVLEGIIQ